MRSAIICGTSVYKKASEIGSCLFLLRLIFTRVVMTLRSSLTIVSEEKQILVLACYNHLSQKYKIKIRHSFLEKDILSRKVTRLIENTARNSPVYTPGVISLGFINEINLI